MFDVIVSFVTFASFLLYLSFQGIKSRCTEQCDMQQMWYTEKLFATTVFWLSSAPWIRAHSSNFNNYLTQQIKNHDILSNWPC